ncbi:MAG: pyridoxal-phosphate dependent enzyme [Glaciecola sp.]|jgi:1-aminocyclopropane-1-carboxylate deaminase|nr:pyridoxal-phosphate dependent enzyme [Glaciecola sp.]MDG1815841.1 pyridoxal-phosphate dependent enzyme [Glaciecola sp.]MDG2100071.1 pyridoxal-phosphate dependent enzyme [Glaciecola sp.]
MLIFTHFNQALITLSKINIHNKLSIELPSPLQSFAFASNHSQSPKLWVKRDDLIHPIISGNKWRKLAQTFTQSTSLPLRIVSFGGGYSNHLHALAYACHRLHIPFHAIIRGNYAANLTPCLRDIIQWHGECIWSTKVDYKRRHDPDFLNELQQQYPDALIIPEGGASQMALNGVAESVRELSQLNQLHAQENLNHLGQKRNLIVTPVATAATLAGLIHGVAQAQAIRQLTLTDILGIAVLKAHPSEDDDYLVNATEQLLATTPSVNGATSASNIKQPNWSINLDFHTGGYAKSTTELDEFCLNFSQEQFTIEPIYSGKTFFAVAHLLQNQQLDQYDNVIVYHTGGLQGIRK